MRSYEPVLWQQGVLLQPQHFQVQDLVHQALLAPVYRYALPHFWGVGELCLEEGGLSEGRLAVRRGSFLFRDGSFTVIRENAVAEERSLDGAFVDGASAVTAFIGLKRWDDFGPNVAVAEAGSATSLNSRLVASPEPTECCELHAGGAAGRVRRQSYLLRLFWEWELSRLGDYLLMPLVRLEKTGEGARIDEAFIPPSLCIAASPRLCRLINEIRSLLFARGEELRGLLPQRTGQSGPLSCRDLALILTLNSLNRALPGLEELLAAGASHPRQLFGILCQLIGELSTFSQTVSVLQGRAGGEGCGGYDHVNLAGTFEGARDLLCRLLREISAGPERVIPLLREEKLFVGDLSGVSSSFPKHGRSFLSLCCGGEPSAVLEEVRRAVKVSSRTHMALLSARSLPGIGLSHLLIPPSGVPQRPHTLHFELDVSNEQWGLALAEEKLAVYWEAPPADLELQLVLLPGDGDR